MVAGDPLGKHQRHRARFYGNTQLRVINVTRRVGEIDVQVNDLGEESSRQQRNREEAEQRPPGYAAKTETRATFQTP
jgi:hypothetical protein